MLIVVSPAKSLDYTSPLATKKFTEPTMLDRSSELIDIMVTKTPGEIERLMSISPALAALNHERYLDWERPFTRKNSRPALLAFDGDVYDGMNARNSFSERDFTHAAEDAPDPVGALRRLATTRSHDALPAGDGYEARQPEG